MDKLEDLWASLLSENAVLIRRALAELGETEAIAVRAHLQRMAEDRGYSEVQRRAARAALEAAREAD